MLSELTLRFDSQSSSNLSQLMNLLPSSIILSSSLSLHSVCKFYEEDLPNSASLESELQLWQSKWRAEHNLASTLNTPEKALVHADKDFYPNIHTLLSIMATLPVTSCECERPISMLRIIKSQRRLGMGQNHLNNLALLYYHYDIEITPKEVVEEFARQHPWRMTL